MSRRAVVACWTILCLPALAARDQCDDDLDGRLARVDHLFVECDRPDAPGCAVGIIDQGRLIYAKGFGAAHLDYEAPNSPTTLFELASASKAFTSACVALLMDEAIVHPDDDVRRWVPELQLQRPVRIRDMLRCESGIWNQFHILPLAGWDNVPFHAVSSKEDLLTLLAGQRTLPFEPGSEFLYGSGDFFLLGVVVERASGRTLPEFARERLFEPLGMQRTYYEEDPGLVVRDRAVGHWKSDAGWSPKAPAGKSAWRVWQTNGYVTGGGGVRTCIADLHRWELAFESDVLPRGVYMTEFLADGCVLGNRFCLDADAYRKREQPHAENEAAGQYRGLKRMQFTGGFWGMTACMSRFPEQRFTVICLSNSGEVSAFTKTREIAELFLSDKMQPVPAEDIGDEPAEPIDLEPEALRQLTGAYRSPDNAPVWQIEYRNGELTVVDHLDGSYVLKPLSSTRFQPHGETPFYASARFEFARDDAGRGTGFEISSRDNGFREAYPFQRIELVHPAVEDLAAYAGTYDSDELAATYRFKVEDDALWLRVNSRRWERLRPVERDEFTLARRDPHDQRFFRFTRGADGVVDGLSSAMWSVQGVEFTRRLE
jgi:CubicO group peptidase (beta-lactamase class C family)